VRRICCEAISWRCLVQMVAVNAMAEYGHLDVTIPPFFGFATVLGGFVFGLGMTLAVGCAGAVLFRAR